MKRIISAAVATALSLSAVASEPKDYLEESYAIGTQLGLNLKSNIENSSQYGININTVKVMEGINHALVGKEKLTYEEAVEILKALDQEVKAKMEERLKQATIENEVEGIKYREQQANYNNVVTTDSGLQYKVLKQGDGEKPSAKSTVTVHYTGMFLDGVSFDSSYDRGQPATFPLSGVIKGWTEGLQLMSVGSIYEFTIPSDLAYGDTGNPDIPPGSTLIFMVELLEVK